MQAVENHLLIENSETFCTMPRQPTGCFSFWSWTEKSLAESLSATCERFKRSDIINLTLFYLTREHGWIERWAAWNINTAMQIEILFKSKHFEQIHCTDICYKTTENSLKTSQNLNGNSFHLFCTIRLSSFGKQHPLHLDA